MRSLIESLLVLWWREVCIQRAEDHAWFGHGACGVALKAPAMQTECCDNGNSQPLATCRSGLCEVSVRHRSQALRSMETYGWFIHSAGSSHTALGKISGLKPDGSPRWATWPKVDKAGPSMAPHAALKIAHFQARRWRKRRSRGYGRKSFKRLPGQGRVYLAGRNSVHSLLPSGSRRYAR